MKFSVDQLLIFQAVSDIWRQVLQNHKIEKGVSQTDLVIVQGDKEHLFISDLISKRPLICVNAQYYLN